MRPVKYPDQDLVRHDIAEPLAGKPGVEVEGRRPDLKRRLAQFGQVAVNCMVRCRADRRRDTGKHCQCCAVDLTGGDLIAFCAQVSILDVVPRLSRMVDGAAEISAVG